MKKIFIILLVISLMLTGCSDVYERIVYDDVEEYDLIWDLPEKRIVDLKLFPKNIDDYNVTDFYCDYTVYFPVGTGYEVLLSVKFDENTYQDEIRRISNLTEIKKVQYDTNNFILPAYVSTIGYLSSNEYVLVDKENYTLHYLYLQLVDKEEMEINTDFLPKGYDYGNVEGYSFSIYDNSLEQQGYK